ncbi:hypothetical protein A4A49_41732 [Nicotiana attenuata]|uniref:Uncharacterized protein n=1 Tax=Nicotiana attenuata TaxID=49451 RepID=A0A1J6JTG5_NICAT|nr:hypothetical protein A4A49_41732 [Nicotiana attenuata]
MSSTKYLLNNSVAWIAVLVPPYLLIASLSAYSSLSISITFCVLVISTIAFTYSKQKSSISKKSVQKEEAGLSLQVKQNVSEPQPQNGNLRQVQELKAEYQLGNAIVSHKKEIQDHGVSQNHVLYCDSESLDGNSSSSEDSNKGQSLHCSDCSICDEESLIEIALPSGHFFNSENDAKLSGNQHQNVFADLAQESIFLQHSLVDYTGDIIDMNEEDNLIEIDISMGIWDLSSVQH